MEKPKNKKVLQPEQIDEIIKYKEDSIFISYCWHDEGNKAWVLKLANDLISNGFKVILDIFENIEVAKLIAKGLACRHILIVLTPKYLNNALVGRYEESEYYNFPAFSIDFNLKKDSKKNIRQHSGKVLKIMKAMGLLNEIKKKQTENATKNMFKYFDVKKLKEWFDFEVFIFEDGYCLQELNMVLMNEIHYEKIFCIQKDGNNSLARYPIIDFRDENTYDKNFSILCRALKSKDHKFRHIYEFGIFIIEKNNELFVYSNKGASNLLGKSLLDIQLWKRSDSFCYNILPSPNEEQDLDLIFQISPKWERI